MQSWELIVLLLSKCAGYHPKYSMSAKDEMGILESQRILSQVTETIRTAFLGIFSYLKIISMDGRFLIDL